MCRSEFPSLRVCIPISSQSSIQRPPGWLEVLSFGGLWRELLEHLRGSLVQVLFILLGLVRHRVFGTAAPDQLLGFAVVHINDESSFLVVLLSGGSLAHSTESPPAPSPAHTVIESLKCLLGMCRRNRYDGYIAAVVYLSPALGCQLSIDCAFNPRIPQGIRGLDFLPRVSLVLREIGLVIKVGFDLLRKCRPQHGHEEQSANCCATKRFHRWISFSPIGNAFECPNGAALKKSGPSFRFKALCSLVRSDLDRVGECHRQPADGVSECGP